MVGINLFDRISVSIAAIIDEVGTDGQGVAGEKRHHLVRRQAGGEVGAVEEELARLAALVVTVVDGMVTEVIVEVDVAGGFLVLVLEGEAGHAADDVGPAVEHRG